MHVSQNNMGIMPAMSRCDLTTGVTHKSPINPRLINQYYIGQRDHNSPNQVL